MKTLEAVQALRGIAALIVALAHIRHNLNFGEFRLGDMLLQNGAVAVDLFFVLSGMIMVFSSDRLLARGQTFPAVTFAFNRACRIVPLYWIASFTNALLGFGLSVFTEPSIYRPLIKSMLFLPQSATGAPQFGYATLFVGWTLNYEVLFYLLFAAALAFGRAKWVVLAGAFALLLVGLPTLSGQTPVLDPYVDYGLPVPYLNLAANPIVWDFVVGVAVGLVLRKTTLPLTRPLSLAMCAAAGLLCAIQLLTSFRSGHGVLHSTLPLAALVLLVANHEMRFGARVPRLLVYLGDISFSLYLWHAVVFTAMYRWFAERGLEDFATAPAFLVLAVATSIALSHVSQRLIERRLSNAIKARGASLVMTARGAVP